MIAPALYSSATVEWETPSQLFETLDAEFNFTLDVCATSANAKCPHFYSAADDGLSMPWEGTCWLNPPYGREVRKWLEKATVEAVRGATVVALLPSRTDTRWWHEYVEPILAGRVPGEVRFFKGRLRFGGAKHSAPFPSALVVFAPPPDGAAWVGSEGVTRAVPAEDPSDSSNEEVDHAQR